MNIHEYQAKELLAKFGVAVPRGGVAYTAAEAVEVARRLGGSVWVVINYFRDNPHSHQWGAHFATPAHLLSAEEWAAMFRDAGFTDVAHRRIPDPTPAPESYTGRWFRDAAQLRAFREVGTLLVHGMKQRLES